MLEIFVPDLKVYVASKQEKALFSCLLPKGMELSLVQIIQCQQLTILYVHIYMLPDFEHPASIVDYMMHHQLVRGRLQATPVSFSH